jgi:hypothetical protein
MDNWVETVLAEYQSDPVMMTLLPLFNEAIDPSATINDFFTNIFNLDTCNSQGLAIWGRIVGISNVLKIVTVKYFGFDEATKLSADPWDAGSPYYSGEGLSQNYILSDDGFRTLIYAKAISNISSGSVQDINKILMLLFPGRGNAYVIDNLDGSYAINLNFQPTPLEYSIIVSSGVLPKPTGFRQSVLTPSAFAITVTLSAGVSMISSLPANAVMNG